MTKPIRSTTSSRVEKAFSFLEEVDAMGLQSSEAISAERAHRAGILAELVADRALDGATDPKTPQGDVKRFEDLHRRYKDHPLISPADPTEKTAPKWLMYQAPIGLETEASHEQWITATKHELAKKYSTREREYSPEDFESVTYTDAEGNVWDTVIYAGPNGIDLGDDRQDYDPARAYKTIMNGSPENTARHTFRIGYEEYDDRAGTTDDSYAELVATMKKQGKVLPDSQHNKIRSNGGDMWYAWTMLTGEPPAGGVSPRIARVDDDGSVARGVTGPGYDYRHLLFRPAAKRKR